MEDVINELWERQHVYSSSYESYHRLIHDKSKISLHTEEYILHTNPVPIRKAGDFLIGFVSPTSTTIDVMVGPAAQWRLDLKENMITKALNGKDYIQCNPNVDIHIKVPTRPYLGLMPTVKLVWAFVHPRYRKLYNKLIFKAQVPYPDDSDDSYELACYSFDKFVLMHKYGSTV